jgi:general L-amino acid transport system permease protein
MATKTHPTALSGDTPATGPRLRPHFGVLRSGDRRFWIQAGLLLVVILFCAFIARNVVVNLDRLGVRTGFAFLARPAGFEIAQALIPYHEQSSYFRAFLVALLNTVVLSGLCIVLATILGFAIGLARLSGNRLLASVAGAYVEIVRNIPLLLQLLFWYFAVIRPLPGPRQSLSLFGLAYLNNRGLNMPRPVFGDGFGLVVVGLLVGVGLTGALVWAARRHRLRTGVPSALRWLAPLPIVLCPVLIAVIRGASLSWSVPVLSGFNFAGGMTLIPEFVAMVVGLSVYSAAFIAEIVRGGILAVSKGQTEASRAIGLTSGQTLRLVVVPQAMRVIIPPLANQYLNLVKNSSLAVAIGYPDLVQIFAGSVLNITNQAVECIAITMAVYLAISLLISAFMNWFNRRVALVER